jgi:hypothetical protein
MIVNIVRFIPKASAMFMYCAVRSRPGVGVSHYTGHCLSLMFVLLLPYVNGPVCCLVPHNGDDENADSGFSAEMCDCDRMINAPLIIVDTLKTPSRRKRTTNQHYGTVVSNDESEVRVGDG